MAGLFLEGEPNPALRGQECEGCGRVAFPPNPYGCEKCGAPAAMLVDRPLAGRGRIVAFVTTTHANRHDLSVPYTMASVALDDGPVIRAIMTDSTGESLAGGDAVETVLVERAADEESTDRVLRFQKREAA